MNITAPGNFYYNIFNPNSLSTSFSGKIEKPQSKSDEAKNVQAVIDTISADILNISMSHITGEDIVNGDKQAVANLLEIFSGLLEFIVDKISSETSSVQDGK